MSWKDILKELSDYERAVAEEFATDEDMERPDYSKTGPFANMPEFPKMRTKDSTTQDEDAKRRTDRIGIVLNPLPSSMVMLLMRGIKYLISIQRIVIPHHILLRMRYV